MDLDAAVMQQQSIRRDTVRSLSPLGYDEDSTDYVKWQGSQTTCSALNQLIKSSANDPNVPNEVSTSRGWQREPSFDQIPGFSLLSTNDNQSALPQSTPQATSSKATRPHSRPRPSLARARSPAFPPDVTNLDLPIPFLDKSNPSSFLDMLKGVSARLDENVGVKPGRSGGGPATAMRPTKRVRPASELQAGRPKRSRASAPGNLLGDPVRPVDKGKRRAVSGAETRGEGAADDHSSMSELPFPLRSSVAPFRHIFDDNASTSMNGIKSEPRSTPIPRPASNSVDPPSFQTLSQTKMPPPPAPPIKHPTANPSPRHIPPKAAVVAPSTSNPPSQQQQHSRSNLRSQSTAADSKPAKSDSGPRFHPLLLEQQAKASSTSSISSSSTSRPPPQSYASKPQLSAISTTLPSSKPNSTLKLKTSPISPSVPSSTPKPPSSQSSRPPALGMRRTHTFPTAGTATAPKTGALPTRQKGFKPPLLAPSQPGSQATAGRVVASQQQQPKIVPTKPAYEDDAAVGARPGGSNGSASSSALSSSGSSSSTSRRDSSAPSSSGSNSNSNNSSKTSVPSSDLDLDDTLPEPLDGDGDSSFGDMMPFDLDALEETMRMYD